MTLVCVSGPYLDMVVQDVDTIASLHWFGIDRMIRYNDGGIMLKPHKAITIGDVGSCDYLGTRLAC